MGNTAVSRVYLLKRKLNEDRGETFCNNIVI